jgi:NifB/MoaA-like Fe-S oxidoreductase
MVWTWTQVNISRLRVAEVTFSRHTEGKTKRQKMKKKAFAEKLMNNKMR